MELHSNILQNYSHPIIIFSAQNKLIEANTAALTFFDTISMLSEENIYWLRSLITEAETDKRNMGYTHFYQNGLSRNVSYSLSQTKMHAEVYKTLTLFEIHPIDPNHPFINPVINITANAGLQENIIIATEERYKTLVEQAYDAFIINDPDGFIIEANRAACDLLGYSREEYIKLNVRDLIPAEELAIKPIRIEELKKGIVTKTERNLIHKSGKVIDGFITSKMLSDGRVMVIARDLTEVNRNQLLIQESEKMLKEAQRLAKVGSWSYDFESNKIQLSDESFRMVGIQPDGFDGSVDQFMKYIHPDDRALVRNTFKKAIDDLIKYDIIYRVVSDDGSLKFINEKCEILYDHFKKPVRASGTIQDVTERKKTEDALKFNETQLDLIYNATSAIIYLIEVENGRFKFISANNAGLKTSGLNKNDFFNKFIEDVIPGNSVKFVEDKYRLAIKERQTITWEEETIYPNGKKIWVVSVTPIFNSSDICTRLVGTVQDITEFKLASERILKEKDLSDSIIKNLPGIFFLFNKEGKFLRWNKNFEEFSVYNVDELKNRSPLDLVEPEDISRIQKVIEEVFIKGNAEIEATLLNRKGEMVPMYFTGWAATFEGEPCLIGMALDISERKKAEKELINSERKFNSLVNTIDGIVWESDANTLQYTFVSTQAEKILGFPANEWLDNKNFLREHLHAEDRDSALLHMSNIVKGDKSSLLEYRLITANGKAIWMEDIVAVIEENGTKLLRGIMTDITERKIKELELKESHEKYMAIINNSMNAFLLTNDDGDIIDTNATALNMFGYSMEELKNMKTWQIFDRSYPKYAEGVAMRKKTGKGKGEVIGLKKNGETFPMAFTSSVFTNADGKQLISAIGIDISDRIQYEESLLKSNERFEKVSEATFDAIWDWDVKTHELYLGEGFKELFGYDVKNNMGEFSTWAQHIHPDDKEQIVLSRLNKIIQYDQDKWRDEYRYLRADGSIAYVLDRGILLRENGLTYRMIGAMQDITHSKKTEAALLESNERFQYVSKATFDAIWDWDLKTNALFWGDGFEHLFGYSLEDNKVSIESWYNQIHEEDRDRVVNGIHDAISSGVTNWRDDYRYRKADGQYAYVVDKGVIIRNEQGEAYRMIGALRDITARKVDEEKLYQLNKDLQYHAEQLSISNAELESFAYVTSHDLQEPLRMVSSFLQLLQKKYENVLDEKGQKYINFAIDGSERMKVLIQDLLEFSRINSSKEIHTQVDLNDTVKKVTSNLRRIIEESEASIKIGFLPTIYGNESQLLQLFQNLIGNALKYKSDKTPEIIIGYEEKEEEWQFFVKDNGIGIDEKFFHKIFVIFQRLHNRKEYDGTGIGLAVCKKIVDFHGGKIWLKSMIGEGSEFYFTISKKLL